MTIKGSAGTGNAGGGVINFQVATPGASGTQQDSFITPLQIGYGGVGIQAVDLYLTAGYPIVWGAQGSLYAAANGTFTFNNNGSSSYFSLSTLGVASVALGNGTAGDYSGTLKLAIIQPGKLYSAAGTALPTCNSALEGAHATVSDATSPTYLGTYASGGAVVSGAFCNGSTWVTD